MADEPSWEALAAVFRAAGWHYTPALDTFSHFEQGVWKAAARALDDFARRRVGAEGDAGMSQWQPIDSAPRDGTLIDLWVTCGSTGGKGRLPNARWHPGTIQWIDSSLFPVSNTLTPTHWMPLPAPPEQDAAPEMAPDIAAALAERDAEIARLRAEVERLQQYDRVVGGHVKSARRIAASLAAGPTPAGRTEPSAEQRGYVRALEEAARMADSLRCRGLPEDVRLLAERIRALSPGGKGRT